MKERPILFSAPMVRAILAGRKTQTRRVAGLDAINAEPDRFEYLGVVSGPGEPHYAFSDKKSGAQTLVRCRSGQPGDRLWVREAWKYADWSEDGDPWIAYAAGGEDLMCRSFDEEWNLRLGDIWAGLSDPDNYYIDGRAADRRWRPSIHMPRWASRITLDVTGVRVERLQDISADDAKAEGISEFIGGWWCEHDDAEQIAGMTPQEGYRHLWERINGPGSWDANPWVWVVSFRRF
jgi:hypothetical protein